MQSSTTKDTIDDVQEAIEEVAEHPWMERLARFGYASKGVVYMIVGALATLAVLGNGNKIQNTRGALWTIALRPHGKVLLSIMAFGLVGYVLWRWVQAIADADGKGIKPKGIAIRTGYVFSGLVYAGLAWTAVQIIFDYAGSDSGDMPRDWTARLMSVMYGPWLVGIAGASVIGFGLFQIYKGYTAKFCQHLKLGVMSHTEKMWARLCGRIGFTARGVVFIIIGIFLIQAARHFNPTEARGLDGALQALTQTSFGPWLLGLVAAGLVAYGLYMLVEARYRRIGGS